MISIWNTERIKPYAEPENYLKAIIRIKKKDT